MYWVMSRGLGQLTVCIVCRLGYEHGVSILCFAFAIKAYSQGRSWIKTRKMCLLHVLLPFMMLLHFPFPAGFWKVRA